MTLTTDTTTDRASGDLRLTHLSASIGTVIEGVDLRDLDEEAVARIRAIWIERRVVFSNPSSTPSYGPTRSLASRSCS